MSWRVGVSPIMDPVALALLGPMGMAMMSKKTVPAVMTVEGHLEQAVVEGARVTVPKEMQLRVHLWRADLLSAVMELDAHGNIVQAGLKDQPIFSPSLLLGYPTEMLLGAPLSSVLPLNGRPHLDALFTDGVIGRQIPGKPGAAKPKGGLAKGAGGRHKAIGPQQTVRVTHATEGTDLDLMLQAVVKQDVGSGASVFVLLHASQPQ